MLMTDTLSPKLEGCPMYRSVLSALCLLFLVPLHLSAADHPLQGDSQIVFATTKEARKLLETPDEFTRNLSTFDKQSRLQTADDVTDEAFLKFAASHVIPWQEEEIERVGEVLTQISVLLKPWRPMFPDQVILVKTTGQEEGNAAYTRRNVIILPAGVVARKKEALQRLLLHELFHIVSRANPKWRDPLYAIVGFEPCGPIAAPKMMADRVITNPDAPITAHCITLKAGEEQLIGAPILYASVPKYDPEKKGPFFRFLLFRMLAIEKQQGEWRVKEKDGKPVVFDASKLASYRSKIGDNTNYIIHPEEILADNFVLLMQNAQDLKTPRVVKELREFLSKQR